MHLRGATSPSPARQQQHGFVSPICISSERRPDASAKETPETPPGERSGDATNPSVKIKLKTYAVRLRERIGQDRTEADRYNGQALA